MHQYLFIRNEEKEKRGEGGNEMSYIIIKKNTNEHENEKNYKKKIMN